MIILWIKPWYNMTKGEKTEELLEMGVNPEMIKDKEEVERLKLKSKLFNFLLIFFILIFLISIVSIFLFGENIKLIKELKIFAIMAIIGIILLFLPARKKIKKSENILLEREKGEHM